MKVFAVPQTETVAKAKQFFLRYKKPIVITTSVVVLQLIFGWDAKFCIINIIWLFV